MRYIFPIMLSAAVLCSGCAKKAEEPVQVVRPVKVIKLETPASGLLRSYPGKVEAGETASLAFQDSGKVIELPIVPGQNVKKGDLLAKIDPRDFEQAVAAAEAKYLESARNTERYQGLHAKGLVATADLQAKEKDTAINKAALEKAQKSLEDATLLAPFDGVVSQKMIENHQNVRGGETVIRVQKIGKIKVTIHIPEKDIGGVPQGQKGAIRSSAVFAAAPGKEFPLTATEWETEADKTTQTFLVKFLMDQPEGLNILPGMTATVRVLFPSDHAAAQEPAFVIPSYAVFSDESGAAFVWIVDTNDMTVHKRAVTLGPVIGAGDIEVKTGLASGDTVVLTGVYQLREGMKVSLITGRIGE